MVKPRTRRDAEILVRNPSPRLFGKKFRESKKVKTNHAETRLRDLSKTLPRFRDPAKIFRGPRFLRYHSPPLHVPPVGKICKKRIEFISRYLFKQTPTSMFCQYRDVFLSSSIHSLLFAEIKHSSQSRENKIKFARPTLCHQEPKTK